MPRRLHQHAAVRFYADRRNASRPLSAWKTKWPPQTWGAYRHTSRRVAAATGKTCEIDETPPATRSSLPYVRVMFPLTWATPDAIEAAAKLQYYRTISMTRRSSPQRRLGVQPQTASGAQGREEPPSARLSVRLVHAGLPASRGQGVTL